MGIGLFFGVVAIVTVFLMCCTDIAVIAGCFKTTTLYPRIAQKIGGKCCRRIALFPENHPYHQDWKKWDLINYTINSVYFVTGTVTLAFSAMNSVGDFGKLINSFIPIANQCFAGGLLALAALNFDGTRLFMPGWLFAYLVLLLGLFAVTAAAVAMYYNQFDVMGNLREGWIMLDFEAKERLQAQYNCCGWDFYEDNAKLPCTSSPERGCRTVLTHEVDARVTILLWMAYIMLCAEMVGILLTIPYTGQLYRHMQLAQQSRTRAQTRRRQEEAKLLLGNSEALRSGGALVGDFSGEVMF